MDQDEKKKILAELVKRGATVPCPRCRNERFTLMDGYFNQTVQDELDGGLRIGGPSIPSVVAVCTNCGFLSQHALGVLGMLPRRDGSGT